MIFYEIHDKTKWGIRIRALYAFEVGDYNQDYKVFIVNLGLEIMSPSEEQEEWTTSYVQVLNTSAQHKHKTWGLLPDITILASL